MSSAGNRKDVLELISEAERNGACVTVLPNGHYGITNPFNGERTQLAFSPRSPHYVKRARTKLKRIGLL